MVCGLLSLQMWQFCLLADTFNQTWAWSLDKINLILSIYNTNLPRVSGNTCTKFHHETFILAIACMNNERTDKWISGILLFPPSWSIWYLDLFQIGRRPNEVYRNSWKTNHFKGMFGHIIYTNLCLWNICHSLIAICSILTSSLVKVSEY